MSNRHSKDALYGLLISVFIFAALESAGHAYFWGRRDFVPLWKTDASPWNQFTVHGASRYRPRVTVQLPRYPSSLSADQYGFIDNGYDAPIRKEDGLVFLLGGSTVEGRGASSNAMTIAAHLERLLRMEHPDTNIRVVNGGRSGHFSYQQSMFLRGEIAPNFSADIVIELDGRNDA